MPAPASVLGIPHPLTHWMQGAGGVEWGRPIRDRPGAPPSLPEEEERTALSRPLPTGDIPRPALGFQGTLHVEDPSSRGPGEHSVSKKSASPAPQQPPARPLGGRINAAERSGPGLHALSSPSPGPWGPSVSIQAH